MPEMRNADKVYPLPPERDVMNTLTAGADEVLMGSERPLVIRLDVQFINRIENERDYLTGGTGHKLPRTAMIRMLLKEALDNRARARGERVPMAIAMGALLGTVAAAESDPSD
jgi:hypothetical protein